MPNEEFYPISHNSLQACRYGFLWLVKYFWPTTTDQDRYAEFLLAAEYGHVEILKFIHWENYPLKDAIKAATLEGHLEVVELLSAGINFRTSPNFYTDRAIVNNRIQIFKFFLDRGIFVNTYTLESAISWDHREIVQIILNKYPTLVNFNHIDMAVNYGFVEMAHFLIQRYQVNNPFEERSYIKFLEDAISESDFEMIKMLIDSGATLSPETREWAEQPYPESLEFIQTYLS